jgi:2-polyprenyl-3-methyl-5-hydroxy-6-metoxy-1,4-benzoquinol methylase
MRKKIKTYMYFLKKCFLNKKQIEANYYKQMFIQNPYWNKSNPNDEELLRWNIIEGYLKLIAKEVDIQNITILDLGCGRGWLTSLLSTYGNVVGIEPVKPVFEYAKKLFPKINFICGTSKDLLKLDNYQKYDLIVASEVIEHIPDKYKTEFIEDISKLLNQKGYLIITTPRKEIQGIWNTFMSPGQPIEEWISESELEKLVEQKSFFKHTLKRFAIPPVKGALDIEVYQLWLFKKK